MAETIGNWSIDVMTIDSITDTKNLPIVDLSYASDYTVAKEDDTEVVLVNTTGSSLNPAEKIRYTRRRVADVYNAGLSSSLDACKTQRANCTDGLNVYAEIAYMLKATNSVSGEEVKLPMRGSIGFTVPTVDLISPSALETLVKRTIACMFDTGSVDGTLAVKLARGDLNPADNGGN